MEEHTTEKYIAAQNKLKKMPNKIFNVKKVEKMKPHMNEIFGESDDEIENIPSGNNHLANIEDPLSKDTRSTFLLQRRVDPSSKVNFAKLSIEEKEKRLKNLAILVKKMKRKLKNINRKLKKNASKLLNKFLKDYLKKHRNEFSRINFKEIPLINYEELLSAISMFHRHDEYEFEDEKYLIQNIISLISHHKLSLNSLEFKHMCSIIRTLLSEESSDSEKISGVSISQTEREYISQFMRRNLNGELKGRENSEVYSNFLLCKEVQKNNENSSANLNASDSICNNNNLNNFGNQFNWLGVAPLILDNRSYFNTFNSAACWTTPILNNFLLGCNNNVTVNNNSTYNNFLNASEMLNMLYGRINMNNLNVSNNCIGNINNDKK